MIILTLFIFSVLAQVPVWAKVVDDFYECRQFFYKETEPQGLDQNAKKICQMYGEEWNEDGELFYASLYSTFHRIPVYSAYTFNPWCENKRGRKEGDWFIEPMLSGYPNTKMMPKKDFLTDKIMSTQAINVDYSNTGYDRGHLNPNSFQCEDGRIATFTLTNAAPMDACFNRVHWKRWEDGVKAILKDEPSGEGTAYLVTGTVVDTSQNYKIPRQGGFDEPQERAFDRVTVPAYVWTAVCYKHDVDDKKSFSFGYIGINHPDSRINIKTMPELNDQLAGLYGTPNIEIFKDNCFSDERKSQEIVKILFKKIQLASSDRLAMSDDIRNTFHAAVSQFVGPYPLKRSKVTDVDIHESFESVNTWFKNTEYMKYFSGSTCVLFSAIMTGGGSGDLRSDDDSNEVVCQVIPEKPSDCTTSCLYNEKARGYYCYHGNTERSCSPTYSIITVGGTTCRSDHTCGTHGYPYYWCYTDGSWDYCSPPLPLGKGVGNKKGQGHNCRFDHNCGWYGSSYTWCYIDNSNNWNRCCSIANDPHSALNGRTCKSDHPCNYYKESYLWCYTTDGTWDYCCTPSQ